MFKIQKNELDKGPRVASASWPAYGDVQPFTGAAKLVRYPVFVSKYVRRLISKYIHMYRGVFSNFNPWVPTIVNPQFLRAIQ